MYNTIQFLPILNTNRIKTTLDPRANKTVKSNMVMANDFLIVKHFSNLASVSILFYYDYFYTCTIAVN